MKLWQKDYEPDRTVERYTVGEDYLLDQELVEVDVLGSLAHATMLQRIGVLSAEELARLRAALLEVLELHRRGEFTLRLEDEDVHTKVENHLTERLGALGKKIHTGRSRNDQVLVDLRLYTKRFLHRIAHAVLDLCEVLWSFSDRYRMTFMAGRTHTQPAMPSSVGLWSAALLEALLDDLALLRAAYELNDQCPLGSAASYGVPLPLDRALVARLLGFSRVQNNVLYANNSRGKFEAAVLFALVEVMLDLSRLAADLILFGLPEFGYFSFPPEMYNGSSIMPQKRNPATLELLRARTSTAMGYLFQVLSIVRALPSGYNRDFQETKAPFMRGMALALSSVQVAAHLLRHLQVNEEALRRGCTPEIFAADRALELSLQGMPFRDAYREVARQLDRLRPDDPTEALRKRAHQGTAAQLGLEGIRAWMERERRDWTERERKLEEALRRLVEGEA